MARHLEVLERADVDSLSAAGVADGLSRVGRLRAWLDGAEGRLLARAAALHEAGQCAAPDEVAQRCGRLPARDARRVVARAEVLVGSPVLHQALDAGVVTGAHIDALGRTLERATPAVADKLRDLAPQLVAEAGHTAVDVFARSLEARALRLDDDMAARTFTAQRRASRVRKWVAAATGMHHVHAELDPERGAAVFAALDAEVCAMRTAGDLPVDDAETDQIAAEAMSCLIARGATATRRSDPELVVIVDDETLRSGRVGEGGACRTDHGQVLPAATARRLACTAAIVPVVLGGDGIALDAGRSRRLATWAQRAALRAMYPACMIDGCDVPFGRCHVHHLLPYEQGGPTDLANLGPLCSRHHHMVHEGGWTLRRSAGGELEMIRPDGVLDHTIALPSREPARQRHRRRSREPARQRVPDRKPDPDPALARGAPAVSLDHRQDPPDDRARPPDQWEDRPDECSRPPDDRARAPDRPEAAA